MSGLRSEQQVPAGCGILVADPDRRFYAGAVDRMIAWGLDLLVVVFAGRSAAWKNRVTS